MMQLTDISLWGVLLVGLMLGLALGLFYVADHRMFQRALRALGLMTSQLAVLGVCLWVVYELNAWWASLLWALSLSVAGGLLVARRAHQPWQRTVPAAGIALIAGSSLLAGSLLLAIPVSTGPRLFAVLQSLLLSSMVQSLSSSFTTYSASLLHTEAHRRYLLANGASRMESLVPSVRRAVRSAVMAQLRGMALPLLVAAPPLFGGQLIGGVSPLAAAAVACLFMAAALAASVLAVLLFIVVWERR
ncbi:MAG: ABC transporter permease [Prevotella sp.]|nr:ABC transporter permease [Prevotella sp.]